MDFVHSSTQQRLEEAQRDLAAKARELAAMTWDATKLEQQAAAAEKLAAARLCDWRRIKDALDSVAVALGYDRATYYPGSNGNGTWVAEAGHGDYLRWSYMIQEIHNRTGRERENAALATCTSLMAESATWQKRAIDAEADSAWRQRVAADREREIAELKAKLDKSEEVLEREVGHVKFILDKEREQSQKARAERDGFKDNATAYARWIKEAATALGVVAVDQMTVADASARIDAAIAKLKDSNTHIQSLHCGFNGITPVLGQAQETTYVHPEHNSLKLRFEQTQRDHAQAMDDVAKALGATHAELDTDEVWVAAWKNEDGTHFCKPIVGLIEEQRHRLKAREGNVAHLHDITNYWANRYEVATKENASLKRTLAETQANLKASEAQERRLQEAIDIGAKPCLDAITEHASLKESLAAAHKENAEVRNQHILACMERGKLREEIKTLKANQSESDRLADLHKKNILFINRVAEALGYSNASWGIDDDWHAMKTAPTGAVSFVPILDAIKRLKEHNPANATCVHEVAKALGYNTAIWGVKGWYAVKTHGDGLEECVPILDLIRKMREAESFLGKQNYKCKCASEGITKGLSDTLKSLAELKGAL